MPPGMPTPFPGMDPYLEHPALWPDVHNALIAAMRDELAPRLRPGYYVALEERTYLSEPDELLFVGRPDLRVAGESPPPPHGMAPARGGEGMVVEVPMPDRVRETFLEVRSVGEHKVVTVLELLSPSNKRPGRGRSIYEEKRMLILGTRTNLVEVDLVRAGDPMTVYGAAPKSDYRILVGRGPRRPRADLFAFGVRDPIPRFVLPLQGEEEPEVDVGRMLHDLYDRAGYDLRLDYRQEPAPPMREADRGWAEEMLKQRGVR